MELRLTGKVIGFFPYTGPGQSSEKEYGFTKIDAIVVLDDDDEFVSSYEPSDFTEIDAGPCFAQIDPSEIGGLSWDIDGWNPDLLVFKKRTIRTSNGELVVFVPLYDEE